MGRNAFRSRINLSKKTIRRRSLYAKKSFFRLIGGPVQGAWLSTPGTLVFRLGEWRGMYNAENEWVPM